MRSHNTLAVVNGGIKSPAPFFRSGAYAAQAKSNHITWRAMLAVSMAHIVALGWVLYNPIPISQQAVLSFTVTMMDVSSSQNTVSSAASAASTPVAKPERKKVAEQVKPDVRATASKKVTKAESSPTPKTSAPISHNAQAQTAVLATITPAIFDAAYLQNPKPSYPALSRRLGEQGNILLSVYVSEEGKAQTVRLKNSSGFSRLDNAALEAVSRWRFASARQGERLVASWVQVPVKFVLE